MPRPTPCRLLKVPALARELSKKPTSLFQRHVNIREKQLDVSAKLPNIPMRRAKLGKYAAVHRVAAAQRHFKKELGDLPENTLRKYKTLYTKELAVRDKRNNTSEITALVQRKRGRPLSLGVNLDAEVQRYILALRHAINV